MAKISAADVTRQIIKEVTEGVTPTSGSRYEIPRKAADALFVVDAGQIVSEQVRPGRNANGARDGNRSVSGTVEIDAAATPAIDILLESALSNSFNTGVLKGGQTDVSFTLFEKLGSATRYTQNKGCKVTNFTFNATAGNNFVTMSFDALGADQNEVTSTPSGTLVPHDDAAYAYVGKEVTGITVYDEEGVEIDVDVEYNTLQLVVGQARNPRNVLGLDHAAGLAASGPRNVTVTLTLFRDDSIDYSTIFKSGKFQSIEWTVGPDGPAEYYGYKFKVYGQFTLPTNSTGDELMLTAVMTGSYDNTAGTAIEITKLADPTP